MKYLQARVNRRSFLKLSALSSTFTIGLLRTKVRISTAQQINNQLPGYGVGAYGQNIYPGQSSHNYLPLVSKT